MNTASVHDRLGRERDEEQQSKSDHSINTASVYYRVGREHHEEQQRKSGKSSPSINTASL